MLIAMDKNSIRFSTGYSCRYAVIGEYIRRNRTELIYTIDIRFQHHQISCNFELDNALVTDLSKHVHQTAYASEAQVMLFAQSICVRGPIIKCLTRVRQRQRYAALVSREPEPSVYQINSHHRGISTLLAFCVRF